MKKACSLVVSALLIAALALPASAASPELGGAAAILPIDVMLDQDAMEIRKVYDLPPRPGSSPKPGFPTSPTTAGTAMTLTAAGTRNWPVCGPNGSWISLEKARKREWP